MITTEYLGFLGSIYPSFLGILIVFSSLVFIALYVVVVTKVVAFLEKNVLSKKNENEIAKATNVAEKDDKDAVKIAIIAAAIAEERKLPVDGFVIKSIKKI